MPAEIRHMQTIQFKKLIPHFVAIASFILIALLYCKPALDGKVLQQSDIAHWKGMSKDIQDYRDTHGGIAPLWTINMFSGMPGFQIATNNNNYISYLATEVLSLFIPKPFRFFILACLGFYFLALMLNINPWLAMAGAIGYAFSTYSPIIISVGHDTKMLSLAYLPAALGGLMMIFDKRYWLGAALTAFFTAGLVYQNHLQIVYYFLLLVVFLTIAKSVEWVKTKDWKNLVTSLSFALIAGLTGVFTNAVMLFTTYDYSKATIRGGQASLDVNDSLQNKSSKGGLDTSYAFLYGSYGIAETITLLVPDAFGGNSRPLGENSKLVETLNEKGLPSDFANQVYAAIPSYWGLQPGHSGPVYLGALFCFLFIFGMTYLRSKHKWWILGITIFAILMSWGKNFATFNTFMFEYLPFYNKFRAPAMILIIPQLTFPLISVMALQQALFEEKNKTKLWEKLKKSGLITLGLFAVAILIYLMEDFKNDRDQYLQQQLSSIVQQDPNLGKDIIRAAVSDRKEIFMDDLIRSIVFTGIGFLLLFAYVKREIKPQTIVILFVILAAMDLLPIGKRYLNDDNFLEPEDNEAVFNPTKADQLILQDKDSHFRVFNLTQDVFNDAITSYHHRSIGGYHAAKLSLYQDLISNQLNKQNMNIQVLNMLDTKYIIVPDSTRQGAIPQLNSGALGSCWLVDSIRFVKNAAAEMKALDQFSADREAIVQEQYQSQIPFLPEYDTSASIKLMNNDHDLLQYNFQSAQNQFVVFSEVYYDRGWKAYVDGKETPIIKVNYVLRGLPISKGKHQIEFRFEPASYYTGRTVTGISQIILVLFFLGGIFMEYKSRNKSNVINGGNASAK